MASINRRAALQGFADHHVSGTATRPTLALCQEARRRTLESAKRKQREFAGLVDADTGQRIGDLIEGDVDAIDVLPLLHAARGRRALLVHTHPGSSAFSPSDVELLLTESCVCAIAAVGANGDLHLLSIEAGMHAPLVARMRGLFDEATQQLAEIYAALPLLGFSKEQQWQEHSYDVWTRIAPALGLRYDRLRAEQRT